MAQTLIISQEHKKHDENNIEYRGNVLAKERQEVQLLNISH